MPGCSHLSVALAWVSQGEVVLAVEDVIFVRGVYYLVPVLPVE